MDYPIMELPFGSKDFRFFDSAETEEYFKWFLDELPTRLSIFKEFFLSFEGNTDIFDFSVESLDVIWKWYLKHVVVEDIDTVAYQRKAESTHEHIRPYLATKDVGKGWTQIAVDIGIYFAQCLLKYCPQLKWGVETEPPDLYIINRPAITGFNCGGFEPINIMLVMSRRVAKGKSAENALSDLFNVWMSYTKSNTCI